MNRVFLIGRLSRDPDIRYTQDQKCIARINIAVDRRTQKEEADFISCKAWEKRAENIGKYLHKGSKIAVDGHIQTGSYTNRDGQKVYTTDVIIDSWEFCEPKRSENTEEENTQPAPDLTPKDNGFMDLPEGMQEELPFV